MKKLLFTFALLLGSLSFLYSSTPDEIFKTFGSEANAQMMTIDENMLLAMKAEAGENADKLDNIESLVVLELSGCDQSVRDRFTEAVGNIQLDGYEVLVRANEDDQLVKVYGKVDGETVHDMLVIVTGGTCVLVQMKGTVNMSDLNTMMNFNN